MGVNAEGNSLYVLTHRKEVHHLSTAEGMPVNRKIDLGYIGLSIAYVKSTNEIWVGSKTGNIHVYAEESLEQVAEFAGHGLIAVDCLTSSSDGTKVGSGDHKRNVKVWNAGSKEEMLDHGHHKNFVESICFTQDGSGIASVSDDHSLVVCDINTKKFLRILNVHGDKKVTSVAVDATSKTVYTVGHDCQMRAWPASETWDKIPQ